MAVSSTNIVIMSGTISRDPYIIADKRICKLTISVLDVGTDGKEYFSYVNACLFGKIYDIYANRLTKDMKVLVQGQLRVNSYEKAGTKVWETVVNVFRMERLADTSSPASPVGKRSKPAPVETPDEEGPTMEDIDGMPF